VALVVVVFWRTAGHMPASTASFIFAATQAAFSVFSLGASDILPNLSVQYFRVVAVFGSGLGCLVSLAGAVGALSDFLRLRRRGDSVLADVTAAFGGLAFSPTAAPARVNAAGTGTPSPPVAPSAPVRSAGRAAGFAGCIAISPADVASFSDSTSISITFSAGFAFVFAAAAVFPFVFAVGCGCFCCGCFGGGGSSSEGTSSAQMARSWDGDRAAAFACALATMADQSMAAAGLSDRRECVVARLLRWWLVEPNSF